jgi:hypothetical protein
MANGLLSGKQKKLHWQRASERIRRMMRNWLTVAVVTTGVTISSIVAPAIVRTTSSGSAVAHASTLPVVTRNRRSESESAPRALPAVAARLLLVIRGIVPRMWGNER